MTRHPFLLGLAILAVSPTARADDIDACGDAYTRAQTLRRDGKLLESRQALRTCAQPTCPGFIAKECATWLEQLQAAIPSVVPAAIDELGNDLAGVTVSIDGAATSAAVDGRSLEVDPGVRTFTFATADGRTQEIKVIVPEGKQDKRVAVRFAAAPPAAIAPPASNPAPDAPPAPPSHASSDTSSTRATVGLGIAGVGVVAVGVGAAFGVMALSKNSESNANGACTGNLCDSAGFAARNTARSDGDFSSVFIGAGAAAVVGGAILWLTAPNGLAAQASIHHIVVGVGPTGFDVKGVF